MSARLARFFAIYIFTIIYTVTVRGDSSADLALPLEKRTVVYFVQGDEGREFWRNYPFKPRTMSDFVRLGIVQLKANLGYNVSTDLVRNDLMAATVDQWNFYSGIKPVIRDLQKKGYDVAFVNHIEATRLLRILADPKTLAVFHGGHSYIDENFDPSELVKNGGGEVYLSVFHRGKPAALTDQVLAEAMLDMGWSQQPTSSIELFFSGACYAGYCDSAIKRRLKLSDHSMFLFSTLAGRPAGESKFADTVETFSGSVKKWVGQLPHTSRVRACANLFAAAF